MTDRSMLNIELVKPYLSGLRLTEPGSLLDVLRPCGAVLGLWGLQSLKESQIGRFMSRRARAAAYIEFDIPKKSGGTRHISAPVKTLKQLQQALNLFLQAGCTVSPAAMGFVPGRSIRTNAEAHVGGSVIFNCDLKDFFPSITKAMVRRTLVKELRRFCPSDEVVEKICNLVTAPRPDGVEALPQGAPTSPVISNLVLKDLDRRLTAFAEKNGYRYTRYADDITFSRADCDSSAFPIKTEAILSIIADCGFTVNPKKTALQTSSGHREVTGLTVSEKVNVSRKYIKRLRVLLHLWETRGLAEAQAIVNRDFRNGAEADLTRIVNGKLNYLCMVKGRQDPTYRKLKYRYRRLMRELHEKLG